MYHILEDNQSPNRDDPSLMFSLEANQYHNHLQYSARVAARTHTSGIPATSRARNAKQRIIRLRNGLSTREHYRLLHLRIIQVSGSEGREPGCCALSAC
jgi:hypothetical protein